MADIELNVLHRHCLDACIKCIAFRSRSLFAFAPKELTMDRRFRPGVVLALALLISLSVRLYGSLPAAAATSPGAMEAALLQPPPEPPSAPPPGAGSGPAQPPEPFDPPADPDTPPADEEFTPPSDEEAASPPDEEAAPPMPSYAPSQAEPLPDPAGGAGGGLGIVGEGEAVYAIAATGLMVSIDRGCGATYTEGESIGLTVTGDWEVNNFNTDWWRYMEVWGSTNGAWWHQVISGRWIEPQQSVYRNAWIAAPVGDERLYARLLDQFGNVLGEANCYYTSQEDYQPPPPTDSWIECGETLGEYVGSGQEDYWYFPGRAGRQVTITMYGDNGFDTYLELYDPNGNFLREHDDISSNNRDARIWLTLPRNGTYTIVAHGYDYRAGNYSLSVRCQ
jgi:hypothetical protein